MRPYYSSPLDRLELSTFPREIRKNFRHKALRALTVPPQLRDSKAKAYIAQAVYPLDWLRWTMYRIGWPMEKRSNWIYRQPLAWPLPLYPN